MVKPLVNRVRLLMRSFFLRRRLEREMRSEIDAHIEQSTERLIARGMSREDAQRAARREFGNRDYIEEQARDARGSRWLETTLADLRFGLRHLLRTPFTTVTMVVMLALGIGGNTGLYAVIYSLTTMPPPGVERNAALVRIRGTEVRGERYTNGREIPYAEYRAYAEQKDVFQAVAAWTSVDIALAASERSDDLVSAAATYVTSNYFDVIGVEPELGADPMTEAGGDGDAPHLAAMISYRVWDRLFGHAPDVVGRTLIVNEVAVKVAGVAPREFVGTRPGGSTMRIWLPLNARPTVQRGSTPSMASADSALFGVAALLRPRVTPEQATAAVKPIAERGATPSPVEVASDPAAGIPAVHSQSADVVSLRANNYYPPSGAQPSLASRLPMLLIPLMILLIPCTNVSALLVGLAAGRRREIAVRLSLGAPRRRIVRQLVTEAVLLALGASLLALAIIRALRELFQARFPDVPLILHPSAVIVAFGVAILTGMMFGISPALHATRVSVGDALKGASGTVAPARNRLQSSLVITQIAITQPLLLGMAALILTTLSDLQRLPAAPYNDRILEVTLSTAGPGERGQQMVILGPGEQPPPVSTGEREEKLHRLAAGIAEIPGIISVAAKDVHGDFVRVTLPPEDEALNASRADVQGGALSLFTTPVSPGFFDLMGYTFLQGRAFNETDAAEGRAVILRSDLARRIWGDANPIGRRLISQGGTPGSPSELLVVGVLDPETAGTTAIEGPEVYVPTVKETGALLIRTQTPSEPFIAQIRRIANDVAPEYPINSATTLAAREAVQRESFRNMVMGSVAVGALALLLSAIGLYAVVAFAVAQRAREIGIRTAFGANVHRVVRLFFLRGLKLCAIGLVAGLAASVAVVKLISMMDGDEPDVSMPLIAGIVAAVVLCVASMATWIPARRAAGVDPLATLRTE